MFKEKVTCPLCKSFEMKEQNVPSKNEHEVSNIWYCPNCPGLLVEYWNRHDADALLKFLDEKDW